MQFEHGFRKKKNKYKPLKYLTMENIEYNEKLEALQWYIPFLVNMIAELKTKGNREAQLKKIQSLYDMITNTKKRLKVETLNKCEEVLKNIYFKVNPQLRGGKVGEPPSLTPRSPSPPKFVSPARPVTIPTEKVAISSAGPSSLNSSKERRSTINVYSNVMIKPPINQNSSPLMAAQVPDMSKPPISLDDLKTLEDDVQQHISVASYSHKTVDELQEVKKRLELQLKVDEINSTLSPKEATNPTSGSVMKSPRKRIVLNFDDDSKKSPIKLIKSSKIIPLKPKSSKAVCLDKAAKGAEESNTIKLVKDKGDSKAIEKSKSEARESKILKNKVVIGEDKTPKKTVKEGDIFGDLLSSIDNKIFEEKKKTKKIDRRPSLTLSKEDSGSSTSVSPSANFQVQSDKSSKKIANTQDEQRNKEKATTLSSEPKVNNVIKNVAISQPAKEAAAPVNLNLSDSSQKPVTTYKRLADKYHPKPKPKTSVESSEIDKAVTESIENAMKTTPVKSFNVEKPRVEVPVVDSFDSNKPVQLPDILQRIFNKPLLGNIIPKSLSDPRIPESTVQNKPSDQSSRLLHFEPPPRFISPPHVPEAMVSPPIMGRQLHVPLLETPRPFPAARLNPGLAPPQQNFPPRFEPPPNASGFGMDFGPSTPRADFDEFSFAPTSFDRPEHSIYPNQRQFPQQQRDVFNQFDSFHGPRTYYDDNQFTNVQPYMPDQQFYHQRNRWMRDRRPGDPRNYREYREMKERQEKAAAEEKAKDIKDPRLAPREPRDEYGSRDMASTSEFINKGKPDPLSEKPRFGEESTKKSKDRAKTTETDSKSNRESSREHKYESNKFDKMYSVTKSAQKGNSNSDEEESFTSPLDSLYNVGERKVGRGYGVQPFKIPRKSRRDEESRRSEKDDKEKPSTKRRTVVISDSDESDAGEVPSLADSDNEVTQKVETTSEKIQEVYPEKLPEKLGIDISRVKVVINGKDELWLASDTPSLDEFVSEYDKEPLIHGCEPIVPEKSNFEAELKQPEKEMPEEVQIEEASSSQDIIESSKAGSVEAPEADASRDSTVNKQETTSKNEEPSEQNILAHFFENLLKSKNKKDKKTALFSLIETFSDSFESQEIQKIRKIIKVNEEEDEASDEEKEERTSTPTVAAKDESLPEELPVVGSTTEEEHEPAHQSTEVAETEVNINQTQVNEVSKSDESKEAVDPEPSVESALEEQLSSLEPVLVSVGERIKSRRRNTPAKPKKKPKSELDLLHADIKDMFIRDGVLTATGKRMCRMLKNDPDALTKSDESPPTTEQPKKIRKKPGPKPKLKPPGGVENSMKSVRIVIDKIPDAMLNTRKLRSRSRMSSSRDSDDENISRETSLFAEDSDKDEVEAASSEESEDEAKSFNAEEQFKPKTKRRKVPKWASGIISRPKKKKAPQSSSPERAVTPATPTDCSVNDFDIDKLIEPDKNYYIDFVNKKKLQCKLCKYSGIMLTGHYLKEHPQSEVLSSRLSPSVATEAIKDSHKNLKFWEKITKFKSSTKYNYSCRMCGYTSTVSPLLFYEHVTTHTGEYRHQCGYCEFTAANSKTMAAHISLVHPGEERKTIKTPYSSSLIFVYMCGECNFVQLNKSSVEDHANIFHLGEKASIYKINMSLVVDPALLSLVDESENEIIPEDEVEDKVGVEPQKRRKPGPKSKTQQEQVEVNKQLIESSPKRRKPGPKSKTRPVSAVEEVPLTTTPPVITRKKPGPKSKTQKILEPEKTVLEENAEIEPHPSRKRRRSLDKLISEDSGDDLDTIITLSSRSSRAAKEKATAKLKTLMESNEGLSPKKKTDTEAAKKVIESDSDVDVEMIEEGQESVIQTSKQKEDSNSMRPPVVQELIPEAKEKDLNVFTCKNDIIQEDAKKIEEERLLKMDELNKKIGLRTSNLDFINKLSNRLKAEETKPVEVKEEPMDIETTCEIYTMPQVSKTPDLVAVRKPTFEQQTEIVQPNITFRQDRPNSLFTNTIEKLQGKVKEAAVQRLENIATLNIQPSPASGSTISIGDFLRAVKSGNDITYFCHAESCHVATRDKMVFQLHCKFGHKNFSAQSTLCEKCGVVIEVTKDTTLLENLYDHLVFAHSDFITGSALRMRRLSGDKLSIKKEKEDDLEHVEEVLETHQESAELVASEATLELAEDNPFSFKIANVMSLAEQAPQGNQSPLIKVSPKKNPQETTSVPPLTMIGAVTKQQPQLVVKEAKQTPAEQSRPKKAPKAMQKFIQNPGDLYKCPHYYCMFSTNTRMLLTVHLKAHKLSSSTAMVSCLYCDMKTPWEHVPVHIDIRHTNCRFSCSHCLYRAVAKEYVCLHLEQCHSGMEYIILALPPHKAAKKFAIADSKVDYKSLCEPFRCCTDLPGVEPVEYLFESEFSRHLSTKHPNQILRCGYPNCVHTMPSSVTLTHWAQFHGVCTYQCAHCKTSSRDIAMLYMHFSQAHANLPLDILLRETFLPEDREVGYTDEAFLHLGHKKQFPANLLSAIGKRGQRSIKLIELSSGVTPLEQTLSVNDSASKPSATTPLLVKPPAKPKVVQNLPRPPTPSQLKLFVASTVRSSKEPQLFVLSAPLVGTNKGQPVTSTAPIGKEIVKPSTASNLSELQQSSSKAPVRIGNITIYPADNSGIEVPVSKNVSKSKKQAAISTVPSATKPLFNTAPSAGNNNMLAEPLVSMSDQTKVVSEAEKSRDGQFRVFEEVSENTTMSEEDILQSAIQSILDPDDGSNNSFSRTESYVSNSRPSETLPITSVPDTHSPELPPLVFLPTTTANKDPSSAPSVEHVQLTEAANEGTHEVCEIDPLILACNDDSNSELPFINSDSLDATVDDPLSIVPTLTADLSSVEPLVLDAVKDPLEVEKTVEAPSSATVPLKISDMRRSASMLSGSDEEYDGGTPEKKRRNLVGHELFRCGTCNLSFSTLKALKSHLTLTLMCKKAFRCPHCDKSLKSVQRTCDHILTHGIKRFTCSLCDDKFTLPQIAKFHMRQRHGINMNQVSMVPLIADQNEVDMHEFIIKPAQILPSILKDKESPSETIKGAVDEGSYTPDQIDSIPIRQIFSTNVKCGLCNYQTKVRVNIIRHLQMHLDEKAVPDTAPINPVPCLEKNEKMFDKMFNLAASSYPTGRMGGAGGKEKEEENHPEFIPTHRRYVCGAEGCAYLCPEEANLKHHLIALHRDEYEFTCAHCKMKIETGDVETVIKHFKFHGLHLYKCNYCAFVHHLKHKVERHISDGHLDAAVKVVTLRAMDSEPIEEDANTPQPLPVLPQLKTKQWSCSMCKAKYFTEQEIQLHISKKHNIDAHYKCTLCSFKNDDQIKCKDHFKEKHPGHDFDIIFMYQKLEDEHTKEDNPTFDTTPLWQRDKPRVRHIRGILFDESSPQPIKTPKKRTSTVSPKISPGPSAKAGPSGMQSYSNRASSSGAGHSRSGATTPSIDDYCFPITNNVSKHLFDCIDAVARGTADTLINEAGPSGVSNAGINTTENQCQKYVETGTTENTLKLEQPSTSENSSEHIDDDVIMVQSPSHVIVIDSDESDSEMTSKSSWSNVDDTPTSKDKDSKINPVAKNRGVKRPAGSDLLMEAVKMAKIEDPEDSDKTMAESCSMANLLRSFGPLGSPNNKQWMCPKCQMFKSKRIADFMFHLYKDFQTYRFRCTLCNEVAITRKYLLDHVRNVHPGCIYTAFQKLAPNVRLNTWIHMVVREQSKQILEKSPRFEKKPITGPTDIKCYFCNDTFMSTADCCEHMLYHWVMMPYQCQYCPSDFYTIYDLRHHHKIEHPDLKLDQRAIGPTLERAIECVERGANSKKRAGKPLQQYPGRKLAAAVTPALTPPPSADNDVINVEDEVVEVVPNEVPMEPKEVPKADEVFACNFCAYFSDTLTEITDHLLTKHSISNSKFHILSRSKSEKGLEQKYACNNCDQVYTELKLREHFLQNHLGTYLPYRFRCGICGSKFLTANRVAIHSQRFHCMQEIECETVVDVCESIVSDKPKTYSCILCSFTTTESSTPINMRDHVKEHLKPVSCNTCNQGFKSVSAVRTHTNISHPLLSPSYRILDTMMKQYSKILKAIVAKAHYSGQSPVAKKSTSALAAPVRAGSAGMDLSNIRTTFEMDDLEYTTTVEQMMKMVNMDAYVDLSDCVVAVDDDLVSDDDHLKN